MQRKGKRMNRNCGRKGLTAGIILLFLGLAIHPIVNVIPTVASKSVCNGSNFDEDDVVEVTCQVCMLRVAKQIIKAIPKARLEKITALAKEVAFDSFSNKLSINDMRQRVTSLAVELQDVELLPQGMDINDIVDMVMRKVLLLQRFSTDSSNLRMKNSVIPDGVKNNSLCLVFGEGKETASIRVITALLVDYLFAIYATFGWELFYKLTMYLMFRPKIIVGFGWWKAMDGGNITTIGLRGKQQWTADEKGNVGVALNGFIGIIVTSLEETGFILGFSIRAGQSIFIN